MASPLKAGDLQVEGVDAPDVAGFDVFGADGIVWSDFQPSAAGWRRQALHYWRGKLSYDMILAALGPVARKAFEVEAKNYEYQSDFAKKYVAEGMLEGERRSLRRHLVRRFGVVGSVARPSAAPPDPM